jgi:hypothetical protein
MANRRPTGSGSPGLGPYRSAWARQLCRSYHDGCPVDLDVGSQTDWIGYSIPITWKGDYLLNGMSATRNTVFKLDGAHEFDVVAESRDFITFGVRRSVLSRMISGLIGRDFAISVDTYRQLHVPEAHRQRLLGDPLEAACLGPVERI